jgi:hypothetical protein
VRSPVITLGSEGLSQLFAEDEVVGPRALLDVPLGHLEGLGQLLDRRGWIPTMAAEGTRVRELPVLGPARDRLWRNVKDPSDLCGRQV